MSQLSEFLMERLKRAYAAYYDVEDVAGGGALKALCAYHSRDSRYVLVKQAELWAAERHEYLYLWDVDHLDEASVEEIFRRVLEDGEPRIKPHSQHMSTYLTAVVLYRTADPKALEQLKKLKRRRDFKLSLHGWMEFRIAAVELSAAQITTNRPGKELGEDLKRLVERALPAYKGEE